MSRLIRMFTICLRIKKSKVRVKFILNMCYRDAHINHRKHVKTNEDKPDELGKGIDKSGPAFTTTVKIALFACIGHFSYWCKHKYYNNLNHVL